MSIDRPALRLLHTADVHIGDEYDPKRRLAAFTAVIDAAKKQSADALLIAGDLFDNARVKQPDIDAAVEQLARLSIPIVISNGNHDVLDQSSIYQRVPLASAGSHILFLNDPEGQHAILETLRLSIWSRAMTEHSPQNRPLAGYSPDMNGYWRIVMAHGHYVPADERVDRSSPILATEIASLTCDYLALGHWHRYLDVSSAATPAYYPGSPAEAGGSFPSVNLVTLDPATGSASVERVPVQF